MEQGFKVLIEKILDMLENDECESYYFANNRFHIVDDELELNLEIEVKDNQFCIRDNVSNAVYYFQKKYLDNETTNRKIIMKMDDEKIYYEFLERDCYIKFVRIIRKDDGNYMICENTELADKDDKTVLKIANEFFQQFIDANDEEHRDKESIELKHAEQYFNKFLNNYKERHYNDYADDISEEYDDKYAEYDEKNESEDYQEDEYYDEEEMLSEEYGDDEEPFTEEDEFIYESEFDDDDDDFDRELDFYDFEQQSIIDYRKTIEEKVQESQNSTYPEEEKDLQILLRNYEPIKVVINGEKIHGKEKILIAEDAEVITEDKYCASIQLVEEVNDFMLVLREIQKFMEDTQEK